MFLAVHVLFSVSKWPPSGLLSAGIPCSQQSETIVLLTLAVHCDIMSDSWCENAPDKSVKRSIEGVVSVFAWDSNLRPQGSLRAQPLSKLVLIIDLYATNVKKPFFYLSTTVPHVCYWGTWGTEVLMTPSWVPQCLMWVPHVCYGKDRFSLAELKDQDITSYSGLPCFCCILYFLVILQYSERTSLARFVAWDDTAV